MPAQLSVLCLALFAAAGAAAQGHSASAFGSPWKELRLGRSALGLSVGRNEFRWPCSSLPGGCDDLSVIGRASVGDSPFSLFGRVGSAQVRTYAMGSDSGYGLAYGAGLSWDFSPNVSARLGWDSYEAPLGPAMRATSLGLQWRY